MLNQLLSPISALRRGVPEALRQWSAPPGRHRRVVPNPFRTNAVRALLAGITLTVIATAAPANAEPTAPAPLDPFDGHTDPDGLTEAGAPSDIDTAADAGGIVEVAGPTDVEGLTDLSGLADVEGATAIEDATGVESGTEVDGLADIEAPVDVDAYPRDALSAINALGGFNFTLPGLDLPALFSPDTAIVVLGYGLTPEGEMRPELINRLYAGYVSALLSPAAPIIVTGGNPQNGVTEAQAMADWLIQRGVAPERIHTETRANSTVQNATFSAQLMQAINVHAAVLITSADHIGRALNNFRAAGISVVATMTPDESPLGAESFGPGE
ncbi:YdcF family protein [Nocardia huaxiensis]|uniref:YdcF family protein n=1 Tax=Nocardia huaxiensis TaxID=2755382 RepID=UPI001E2C1370|nr:YdcF family protein [Nocardia huaxiensis]UFS99524.1 YdcF family protein [Nocardia huaxiensis]